MPSNPHALMTGLVPTGAEEIALGVEQVVDSRDQLHRAVQAVAADLGITNLLGAHPLQLSGGQTQLVALAAYLVLGRVDGNLDGAAVPALALDEPLLGLDDAMRARVLDAFTRYPADLAWASARPQADEKSLAASLENLGDGVSPSAGAPSLPPLPARAAADILARDLSISPVTPVRRRWKKSVATPVATGIKLDLTPGDCLILTGPNGAGKSTLLRTIAGLLPPAAGQLTIGGLQPYRQDAPARVALAQLVAQTPAHHFLASTVDADIKLGSGAKVSGPIREALRDAVLPTDSGEIHPLDLLPAEQHLLALAEALAAGASCLLLDEPTAGLEAPGLERVAALIAAHCAAGGSAIVATHDQQLTQALAARLPLHHYRLDARR
ncbi:ATP-binding cassette domain-containing protein [Rothia nasimurium]|uniref:ATP-binding cassette domain-containing protein n=1 Tax=Rothia nasimurium TaxID=85336 RepID=A0A4Y9F6F4_9MICC|nr:ATP-binding cassette domain-containing protein [Rothia nasimurium]MBF0807307.1 ATP-binding cassette domain-containing protein [Rothia nasimurium]TFU24049.1 ATP-binding cassette domain-containing protein [Rothia nasimurium]